MARDTGPKLKKSRRLGQDLGHKQNLQKVARRLDISPGQHGQRFRRGRRKSEYGLQLLEKQKIRYMYGVLEKQFDRYVKKAQTNPQATGEELLKLLERRLDNIVYRLGFAPTRPMARQLVNHGHIQVNNKKINIPSFQISVGDIITIDKTTTKIPDVIQISKNKDHQIPKWMQKKAIAGKITRLPEREDIDTQVNEQLIVEFYSR